MSVICWAGPPSPFEVQMALPLPTYALEQLRQRFFFTVVAPPTVTKGARVALQMAFETEIGSVLTKMLTLAADVEASVVCERRHFIDIDKDIQSQGYLITPAFTELAAIPNLPTAYATFLQSYSQSDYPRYRVCAIAAALCMATTLLNP